MREKKGAGNRALAQRVGPLPGDGSRAHPAKPLEVEFERELQDARRIRGTDHTQAAGVDVGIRQAKVCVVEDVEALETELDVSLLTQERRPEVLEEAGIHVRVERSSKCP